MMQRVVLVLVLAIVVGFGVMKVFEQGSNTRRVAESGEQLDATLSGDPDVVSTERWYDHPMTIGLMAGGAVFVVGVAAAAVVKPHVP